MSGPELLLLLYEEAIRRLSKAEYALEDKEYGMFEDSLLRTSRIVRYLIDILDMQQPISRDLRRIYQYLIYDIVISDQAEIDLRGIFEYIAFELQTPENASGQLDRLEACILSCAIYSG